MGVITLLMYSWETCWMPEASIKETAFPLCPSLRLCRSFQNKVLLQNTPFFPLKIDWACQKPDRDCFFWAPASICSKRWPWMKWQHSLNPLPPSISWNRQTFLPCTRKQTRFSCTRTSKQKLPLQRAAVIAAPSSQIKLAPVAPSLLPLWSSSVLMKDKQTWHWQSN